MEKRKRVCIYSRVGDYRNGGFFPLMMHELRSYCANKGYEVVLEYEDYGSGNTLQRKGLKEMMAQAASGAFDILVIKRHSTLARSMADLVDVIDQLDKNGIEIHSVVSDERITHEHIEQLRAIFNNSILKEFKLKE